jgi:succinate dehydrogenase / fumarate reductase flavoprotein subunit
MHTKVGIVREEKFLKEAIAELAVLRERAKKARVDGSRAYNPGWHLSHDLINMIDASEIVAKAALQREDSRGGHTRLDFNFSDDKVWRHRTSVASRAADGTLTVSYFDKPQMPKELVALFDKAEEKTVFETEGKF